MNRYENRSGVGAGYGSRRMRRAGTALALLWACLLAVACTKTPLDDSPDGGLAGDEATVRLTVSLPQPTLPRKTARAAGQADEEAENRIAEVMVLVFEQENGSYVYRYMTAGDRLTAAGSTTQFKARLVSTSKPVRLVLAGNYGDAFENYAPSPGSSESEVRTGMGLSFAGIAESLPMSGEIDIPSGLQTGADNSFQVRMLRSVARTDIVKELAADSRPFRIGSVYLYRANDKVQLVPNEALSPEAPRVTGPSVFPGAKKSGSPTMVPAAESDPLSVTGIYTPEAAAESDPAAQLTAATCIVVGGYYDGQSQPSYYRIDFDPGLDGHPFGQVLRNHKYVFRIRKVTGPGWNSPELAATNRATSIVAEVEAWEDFTTEMYFEGDNYIGVSSRDVTLGYLTGKSRKVDVQATIPYTIQWLDSSGNPVGTAVSGVGATLSGNSRFTVSIGRDASDEETTTHLVFTTTQDNRSTVSASSRLRITAGRWTLNVTVTQESPERYRKRVVRVLSIKEVGDLGSSTPSTASGLALRRILDNKKNFSPDGTVIIGGFSFSEVSNSEIQATGTGSASDKEIFNSVKSAINAQDVIYLTYNSQISNELAQIVLAWLRAASDRVLIVGTDTESTNAKLRQYLTGDGTWQYYYLNNIGSNFKRAAQTDGNKRFFATPFGTVAENAPISRADGYAAYCSDYPATVTPLVVSAATGHEKAMIVGADLAGRIVYHGDANLSQNGQLSSQANADGTVTTDFDRLTANLWAWIVEQVCSGI